LCHPLYQVTTLHGIQLRFFGNVFHNSSLEVRMDTISSSVRTLSKELTISGACGQKVSTVNAFAQIWPMCLF
jgi:hypothetical protein